MSIEDDKQALRIILSQAFEVLDNVILPMCGIEGAWADPYLADISCYCYCDEQEQEIVEEIINKYNLYEGAINECTPLALISLLIVNERANHDRIRS